MKQRMLLIASVVVGLLAALLTGQYLRSKDKEYQDLRLRLQRDYNAVKVIVARNTLPAGTVLAYQDMAVTDLPEKAVRGKAVRFEDRDMLVGKKLVRPVEREAPIAWADLEGGDPFNRGLAGDIVRGQRAISIGVGGAAAVSGMVRPNDHVDILATFTFPSDRKSGEMEMVTLTLLQDVLVLATGRETSKSQLGAIERNAGGYSTVTIAVTPREAEMLVFGEQARGRLVLTLRNPADIGYVTDLPRVDFAKIQEEITLLNKIRQETLLLKPPQRP